MYIFYFALVLLTITTSAFAQQEARSAKKGASDPLPITGSVIDADHNALDVKCLSGCSGGGGGSTGNLGKSSKGMMGGL